MTNHKRKQSFRPKRDIKPVELKADELLILPFLAVGFTTKQIAKKLTISQKRRVTNPSITSALTRAYRRNKCRNRNELVWRWIATQFALYAPITPDLIELEGTGKLLLIQGGESSFIESGKAVLPLASTDKIFQLVNPDFLITPEIKDNDDSSIITSTASITDIGSGTRDNTIKQAS